MSGVAYPEFLGKFNTDQSKYFNDANLLITVEGIAQSTITMVDLNDDCQLWASMPMIARDAGW